LEALTVNRLLAGIFAASLLVAACGAGAPGTSPGTGGAPGAGDGQAALTELCGTGNTSLTSIATELEGMNESTDTATLSTSIGGAIANLEDVDVAEGTAAARDAAVVALQQLQTVIQDPSARQAVAGQAATALRTLETQLCA
jgi:hypothetical protein